MTVSINDYPYASDACCCGGATCCCTTGNGPPGSGKCGDVWGCTVRQCTSFCRYRIANDLHMNIGGCPGNGGQWAAWFAAHGYRVDFTPAANSILCLPNISKPGHVAFVMRAPTPSTAECEQYNWGLTCGYSQRTFTVATSGPNETRFIHLGTGNACSGVNCPACQSCVAGQCFNNCPPGQGCVNGLCAPPTPLPPMSTVVPLVIAGAAGTAGYLLYRRRTIAPSLYSGLHGGSTGGGFGAGVEPPRRRRPRRSVRGMVGFS